MKTLEEILNTTPVFITWENEEAVFNDFSHYDTSIKDEFTGYKVLFAVYESGGWEGSAFVIASKDGNLFEIHGGHCSCNGLEGQWSPEPVVLKELESRVKNQTSYLTGMCDKQLKVFLGIEC